MQTSMTTSQAFRQLLCCHAIIAVNTWNGINYLVTRRSWLTLATVTIVSIAISAICIMSARAERDHSLKRQAYLQQQIEQLQIAAEMSVQ